MNLLEHIEDYVKRNPKTCENTVKDYLSDNYSLTFPDAEFICGYTGAEGEGENVNFVCRLEDKYYRVFGTYDSWNGTDIYWGEATLLGKNCVRTTRTLNIDKEVLIDEEGKIIEIINPEISLNDPSIKDQLNDSWN